MPVLRKRGSGGAIPTVASANGALAAPKTATEFRAAAAQVAAQKQAQRAEFELMKKELEVLRTRSIICDWMALKCWMCANAGRSARGSAATETRSPPARTRAVPSPAGGATGERASPEGWRDASRGMALIACGARNPAVARAVSRARADCTPPPRRRGFREVFVHSCASFRHEKNCE